MSLEMVLLSLTIEQFIWLELLLLNWTEILLRASILSVPKVVVVVEYLLSSGTIS